MSLTEHGSGNAAHETMLAQDDVATCPICLDIIGESNSCKTSCNHSFCLSCLYTSLLNKNSCPMCRNELVPENRVHKDRKEVVQLREYADNAYIEIRRLQEEVVQLREDTYHDYIEIERTRYNGIDANEPMFINLAFISHVPCDVCGCSSEYDLFGDKTCFCDSCEGGCVNSQGVPYTRQSPIVRRSGQGLR